MVDRVSGWAHWGWFLIILLFLASSSKILAGNDPLPANCITITEQDIRNSRAQNLSEILENVAPIQVIRTGIFGAFSVLKMRGASSPSQINILMNGHPLAGSSKQFIDVSRIPAENIDHIEIIEGAASGMFPGDISGGAINVITRKPKGTPPDSNLSAQARSKGTQYEVLNFTRRGNRLGGGLSYGRFRTNGFQVNAYSKFDSFDGLLQYSFPSLGELEAEGTIWDGTAGDPRGTPVDISQWNRKLEEQPVSEYSRTEENTKTGRLTHRRRWTPDLFSEESFFVLQRNFLTIPTVAGSTVTSPGEGPTPDYASRDSLVNVELKFVHSSGLSWGGSFQSDDLTATDISRHHDFHWNGFLIHSHTFGRWTEISRLQTEKVGSYGLSLNPRVSLVMEALPWLEISGNIGRSRRIPSFVERFYKLKPFIGNDGLAPERTWTYDIGFQIKSGSTSLRSTGFYTRTGDRIAVSSNTFVNSGTAEQKGLEMELTWFWKKLESKTSAMFLKSQVQPIGGSGKVSSRLSPPLSFNSTLTFRPSPLWTLWGRVRYLDKQSDQDDSQGTSIPRHAIYDAELTRHFWKADIFVRVENITNKIYAESTGFDPRTFGAAPGGALVPQLPRAFWAGISIHFTN